MALFWLGQTYPRASQNVPYEWLNLRMSCAIWPELSPVFHSAYNSPRPYLGHGEGAPVAN
jgi:hypothetical protein